MKHFYRIADLILAATICLIFLPIYLVLIAKDRLTGTDDNE